MGANGKKHLRRSKHHRPFPKQKPEYRKLRPLEPRERDWACLLYTSDAADEGLV